MNKFREKIYQIIAENLGLDPGEVRESADFAKDLNAGDLEMAELIESIEQNMQVKINEEEVSSIETVGDLVHTVFDRLDGLLEEEEGDASS